MFSKLRDFFSELLRNQRAVATGEVIGLAVSFFLVAVMGPIAIQTIANLTTYNQTWLWDSSVITIFQVVLPILWVVGVAVRYLPGRE